MLPERRSTRRLDVPERCRLVREVLSRVGDNWSVLVVTMFGEGLHGFNALKRAIGSISHRILTRRGLERDGLLVRVVTTSITPRVDYDLTELVDRYAALSS